MPDTTAHAPCPACQGRMYPRQLECMDCGLQVETHYARNEFSALDDETLHLLRIFVACEGRIRDMEAALGVSYPTVKARLADLRGKLGVAENRGAKQAPPPDAGVRRKRGGPSNASDVIAELERGEIDYEEALRQIKGTALE